MAGGGFFLEDVGIAFCSVLQRTCLLSVIHQECLRTISRFWARRVRSAQDGCGELRRRVLRSDLSVVLWRYTNRLLHYRPTACRIVRTSYKTFLTSSRALDCTSMSPYVISSDNIFLAPCWKTCIHTFQEIRIFVEHL